MAIGYSYHGWASAVVLVGRILYNLQPACLRQEEISPRSCTAWCRRRKTDVAPASAPRRPGCFFLHQPPAAARDDSSSPGSANAPTGPWLVFFPAGDAGWTYAKNREHGAAGTSGHAPPSSATRNIEAMRSTSGGRPTFIFSAPHQPWDRYSVSFCSQLEAVLRSIMPAHRVNRLSTRRRQDARCSVRRRRERKSAKSACAMPRRSAPHFGSFYNLLGHQSLITQRVPQTLLYGTLYLKPERWTMRSGASFWPFLLEEDRPRSTTN